MLVEVSIWQHMECSPVSQRMLEESFHLQQITPSWLGTISHSLFLFVTLAQLAFRRSIGHRLWITPSYSISHIQNETEASRKFTILLLSFTFVEVETISMISKLKKRLSVHSMSLPVILVMTDKSFKFASSFILGCKMGITALLYDTT